MRHDNSSEVGAVRASQPYEALEVYLVLVGGQQRLLAEELREIAVLGLDVNVSLGQIGPVERGKMVMPGALDAVGVSEEKWEAAGLALPGSVPDGQADQIPP